jgi:hypothetical protein
MQRSVDGNADMWLLEIGTPVPMFPTQLVGANQDTDGYRYIVSPNGQRFLMNMAIEEVAAPITVILNWKAKP